MGTKTRKNIPNKPDLFTPQLTPTICQRSKPR
nr:MAG TPA: hypothetical protein [Caudoviricetes sp.]